MPKAEFPFRKTGSLGGATSPEYSGTLGEKFDYLKKLESAIKRERKKGIRESEYIDRLLEWRGEIEIDIDRHLLKGEKLPDPLADYCIRHFSSGEYTRRALEKIPLIKKFTNQVKEMKGQKILIIREYPRETGKISGPCQFRIEKEVYRHLFVPVEELFVFDPDKGDWRKSENGIFINHDIFKYRPIFTDDSFPFFRGEKKPGSYAWRTDYSKEIFIGGTPKDIAIYLGDNVSENALSSSEIKTVKKMKVPNPW